MRLIPLMGIVLLIYNLVSLAFKNPEVSIWEKQFITFSVSPEGAIRITYGTAIIIFALFILFIELVKSTTASNKAMIEQLFSTLAFIGFLMQFILTPYAAEPTFFVLSAISLVEVLAGFVIMIKVARRDIGINR